MTVDRPPLGAQAPTPKKRKLSKRTVKIVAWVGGAMAFALPWAVIQAVPRPAVSAGPQLVAVPAGSHVVIKQGAAGSSGAVVVTTGKGGTGTATVPATTPAVATTGGSAPPPPGV